MKLTENRAPGSATLWLLATAVLTIVPHAAYLPPWVSAGCAALLLWASWRVRSHAASSRLHRVGLIALAAGLVGATWAHFGYFFGKEPGLAMLALLLCLKLLEGQQSRDIRVGVLLAFFLQLGLFFDDQTLPVALLALGGTLLATATLIALEDPQGSPGRQLRQGGQLMLLALPFLLVLFVLFPRLPGPLWGLPQDAHRSITGLSDEMSPGMMTELTQSSAIALRAEFRDAPPPPAQRYWRGPVLSEFDGQTWRARPSGQWPEPTYTVAGPAVDYALTVEPHNRRWVLALDYPAATGRSDLAHTGDFQLRFNQPIRNRTRFALSAYPEARTGLDETPEVLRAATRLPESANPRTRTLVAELTQNSSSSREAFDTLLAYIANARLTYTLSVPDYGPHPVDGFLFNGQRGFCEHFSSAFVFMMRAAGVPARIVTGYLGGEINPIDGSMVVRQSDAHAWAEVWLPGEGWLRADPTALAAPQRLLGGLSAALPESDWRPLLMRQGPTLDLLRAMRHRWEAVSNAWNRNVLGYDRDRQRELLSQLGLHSINTRTLATAMLALIGGLLTALALWALVRRPVGDALDHHWNRYNRKLARKGLARLPSEGPLAHAERVAKARPAQADEIRALAALYARLRYGPQTETNRASQRELAQRIRDFKLK